MMGEFSYSAASFYRAGSMKQATGAANQFSKYGAERARTELDPINFDQFRSDNPLSAVAGAVVKLTRAGNLLQGRCPFHADNSPSFTVYPDQRYHCFGCGAHGDVVDFVMALHGVGYGEALSMLDGGRLPTVPARDLSVNDRGRQERIDEAAAIWANSGPIVGTPAESYLRRRAITVPLPECLRFARLRFRNEQRPCLVALVQAPNGDPQAVHRIFLTESGGKANLPGGKVKFSLGPLSGGAIRLSVAASEMGMCASVEDGLSLIELTALPVWAVTGDPSLDKMTLPDVVRSVVIGHDADQSGRDAAGRAAKRHALEGLRVRTLAPRDGFKDFNAELMEARK